MSFDASLPGTSVEAWNRDPRLAALPPAGLDGFTDVVVVAAHPDDETLGAGALIATAAARGLRVTVVIVTDGAASHPGSASVSPGELRQMRSAEARSAVALLAPHATVVELGFADGAVRESRAEIAGALAAAVDRAGPDNTDRMLLVAPWRGDGHRDHRVTGEITAELADARGDALLEYPVWMWHWAAPHDSAVPWDDLVALVPDETASAAKRAAIGAYVSQTAPLGDHAGDEAMLHPEFLRHFRQPREVFVRTAPHRALDAAYFDDLYARHDDPWGFTSRWYERRKRAATLAALPAESYGSALEIGCSIGVLTAELAARCTRLLAVDVAQPAVDRARVRLAAASQVTVERMDVAERFPVGPFDLVVLSEVGYYFTAAVLDRVLDDAVDSLGDGGTLVACHWRHTVEDYALTGDEVHIAIARRRELTRIVHHEEDDFVLEVFSRDGRSVAARTGLL